MKQWQAELPEQNAGEISLYSGEKASPRTIATELAKLKTAFPQLENQFISVLSERISANGFTDARLIDAVSNLIDNFKYPRPSIADVIGFDCRIRIFSYSEYANEVLSKRAADTDFVQHWIDGKLYFVKLAECERYNFKPNKKND